jgi:DNA-3-methyladenine glycosylase II
MTQIQSSICHIVNKKDVDRLRKHDRVISYIYNKFGAPPNWSRPEGFVSLSRIILEQQVSLASANAHYLKLNGYLKKFTAENILKLTDEEMRNCQISRQKTKYLRCLSEAIINKNIHLHKLHESDEIKIREILTSIKGIGNWTTDIYLMFCMQKKNIFPVGDIAVINTIKKLYEVSATEEIISVAENWNPNRSLGTYFMWHHYLEVRKK